MFYVYNNCYNLLIFRCKQSIFQTNNGLQQNQRFDPKTTWEKESSSNRRNLRRPVSETNSTNGFTILTRTISNPPKVRSPQNYSNTVPPTRRQENNIVLSINTVYEIVVSHIVNETSCYVNLTANSEVLERIAYDVNRLAVNGKAVEAFIGNTYGAKLDGIW